MLKRQLFYICLLMYSNSIPLLSVPKTSSTWKANITVGADHKVLTYIEYRAESGVFRTIDLPPPLHPASASSPLTKGGEVHTRRAGRGWGGVNISEDARHWIGLLQYKPSTEQTNTGLALRQFNKVLLGSQPFVTKPRISSINPKVRLRFVKLYRV